MESSTCFGQQKISTDALNGHAMQTNQLLLPNLENFQEDEHFFSTVRTNKKRSADSIFREVQNSSENSGKI